MGDTDSGKNVITTVRKVLLRTILAVMVVGLLGSISLKIYLESAHAASFLSEKLTSYLHQPFRVAGIHFAGGTIYLTAISLANPPDTPPGTLVSIDSATITPNWGAVLTGGALCNA